VTVSKDTLLNNEWRVYRRVSNILTCGIIEKQKKGTDEGVGTELDRKGITDGKFVTRKLLINEGRGQKSRYSL